MRIKNLLAYKWFSEVAGEAMVKNLWYADNAEEVVDKYLVCWWCRWPYCKVGMARFVISLMSEEERRKWRENMDDIFEL